MNRRRCHVRPERPRRANARPGGRLWDSRSSLGGTETVTRLDGRNPDSKTTPRDSRRESVKGVWRGFGPTCRTHELKSGDRRRPETERQGLAPRPSHDSRVASREFVTHRVRYTATARPNSIIGTPGVVTCASSLRCELHSRLQSPQVTTEDCPVLASNNASPAQRGPRRDAQPLHATPLAAVLFPARGDRGASGVLMSSGEIRGRPFFDRRNPRPSGCPHL